MGYENKSAMLTNVVGYVAKATEFNFKLEVYGNFETDIDAYAVFRLWDSEVPILIKSGKAVYDSSYNSESISKFTWTADFLTELAELISVVDAIVAHHY